MSDMEKNNKEAKDISTNDANVNTPDADLARENRPMPQNGEFDWEVQYHRSV